VRATEHKAADDVVLACLRCGDERCRPFGVGFVHVRAAVREACDDSGVAGHSCDKGGRAPARFGTGAVQVRAFVSEKADDVQVPAEGCHEQRRDAGVRGLVEARSVLDEAPAHVEVAHVRADDERGSAVVPGAAHEP